MKDMSKKRSELLLLILTLTLETQTRKLNINKGQIKLCIKS